MAKLTPEKLIESLNEMNLLEIKELVDALVEAYDIDLSAAAVAAPAAADAVEESSTVNVEITAAGPNKIAVIKIIKEITGEGLKEAKAIADNGGVLKEDVEKDEAEELKAKLEEAGATIELK